MTNMCQIRWDPNSLSLQTAVLAVVLIAVLSYFTCNCRITGYYVYVFTKVFNANRDTKEKEL